uniref:Uncharacterized protein n=1 Tax=Zonotrichia albicollis TaxID=44394 RepID=A0A8D2M4Y7_ZONAL
MVSQPSLTVLSGCRHATGKAQHGNFLVAIKQEKGESARVGGEKPEEEVSARAPGEEEGLAQGQEEEEDPSQWPQSPCDGLRALPERAARADPHTAPRPALPRDHKDAGSRVEQTAGWAVGREALPGS